MRSHIIINNQVQVCGKLFEAGERLLHRTRGVGKGQGRQYPLPSRLRGFGGVIVSFLTPQQGPRLKTNLAHLSICPTEWVIEW